MAAALTTDERFRLIARRQSLLSPDDEESMKRLLQEKPNARIVWETTPTGRPHVGYLVPLAKFIDFLRAGLDVTVLYLDVYGFLINYVHPMELVAHRKRYYQCLITAVLEAIGVPMSRIRFVDESTYVYTKEFMIDFQKLCALMAQQDARDTTQEVAQTSMLSPLLCSVHQALSERYMDMDIQFGGEDQWGLFEHAVKFMPRLGYGKREHIMNVMVSSLKKADKMASSDPTNAKIEFLDDPATVRRKLGEAPCSVGNVGNAVLGILRDVLIPVSELRLERQRGQTGLNAAEGQTGGSQEPFASDDAPPGTLFSVRAQTAEGEQQEQHYASYGAIEADFAAGKIQAAALKDAVANALSGVIEPVRRAYAASAEWQRIDQLAYPVPEGE